MGNHTKPQKECDHEHCGRLCYTKIQRGATRTPIFVDMSAPCSGDKFLGIGLDVRFAHRFGMISGAHVEGCVGKFEQFLPEIASKHSVSIRNNDGWHSMEFIDVD